MNKIQYVASLSCVFQFTIVSTGAGLSNLMVRMFSTTWNQFSGVLLSGKEGPGTGCDNLEDSSTF